MWYNKLIGKREAAKLRRIMQNAFSRTQLLLGSEAMAKLKSSRVAVFGIGGVGCGAVEALARSGIGQLDLIDNDAVSLSNINRQLIATHITVGMPKVEAAAERIRSINPECTVNIHQCFFLPETADQFDFTQYDYVIDAIDTVSGKIALVLTAETANVPIICAMGAGNKLDPTAFRVADISKTAVCPLARVMRRELKKRGINRLKVVYSEEEPAEQKENAEEELPEGKRSIPGSVAFVPPVMGFIMAGEVIKDLTGINNK